MMPSFSIRHLAVPATFLMTALACSQTASPTSHRQKNAVSPASSTPVVDLNAPLPNAALIRQRVLENLKKTEAEQERYICRIAREEDEMDKHGNVKKGKINNYDMFYVNGREIDELTAKNGKTLDTGQQAKEADRVKKEIEKDSDEKRVAKEQAEDEKQLDLVLHALRYTNGHRQLINGRATLVYDLSGDPAFHPKNVQETFVHYLTGTIQIDESTGELVDLNAHLDHDVKIGGGLLANVHKGFWLHVHQLRQADGVWIPDVAEGKGDARAALFLHPYFQFKQTTSSCHLTNVTTQTGEGTVDDSKANPVKID